MTADIALDRARRYLKPVPRLQLPDEPDDVHLALYGWEDRLEGWVAWSTALCGRSTEQGDLPMDAGVTCAGCLTYQPQYEAVLAMEAEASPSVADRVAARRDPRYPVVLREVQGFGWPAGNPMVRGTYADVLATRVMTALRAQETDRV
jgi:hypothetical protein